MPIYYTHEDELKEIKHVQIGGETPIHFLNSCSFDLELTHPDSLGPVTLNLYTDLGVDPTLKIVRVSWGDNSMLNYPNSSSASIDHEYYLPGGAYIIRFLKVRFFTMNTGFILAPVTKEKQNANDYGIVTSGIKYHFNTGS